MTEQNEDAAKLVRSDGLLERKLKRRIKMSKYYSVRVKKEMEVCVRAEDENDAEEIAREGSFGWEMADIEVIYAEEEYNEQGDADLIQEFKDEDRYAE